MSQAVPKQHPAVVLRSHYTQLRALLAIAMIAVVGMTIALVVVANDDHSTTGTNSAAQQSAPGPAGSTRYDGGPEEGTRGPLTRPSSPPTRYDGGPEEGSRGPGY
jgi:hypothetical protein